MIIKELKSLPATQKDLKNFGLLIGGILILFGLLIFKNIFHFISLAGIILVVLGFLQPKILKPLYYVWMAIAFVMGWFVTRVILFIFFILVITLFKIILGFSGDPLLDLKIKRNSKTYWTYRHKSKNYDSMLDKQF